MDIQVINTEYTTYSIIDNVLDEQSNNILKESIIGLEPLKHTDIDSAKDARTGYGIWLNKIMDNKYSQDIITNLRFVMPEIFKELSLKNTFFKISKFTNFGMLLNYYGDGHYYKPHIDDSVYTIVHFINAYDYSGGQLKFPEIDHIIEPTDNRMVIFNGLLTHEVLPVSAKDNNYRTTLVQLGL